jgi:trk system potassium uptake protein TrkA
MNIIIAGAGKVGFNLAKSLLIRHNVTIIDKNLEALYRIQESLDILPLKGDVEDVKTYQSLKEQEIDLFIAVTNIDDVNLISTMIASSVLNIKKRFVRLQKYFDKNILKEKLDIDKIIFPTQQASKGIASLLKYPRANNVKVFKYTDYKLVSFKIARDFQNQIIQPDNVTIVGIERDKKFFIPQNNTIEFRANDLIYFFGQEQYIKSFCSQFNEVYNINIQKCVIFGGEDLGISIAKELLKIGCEVKLVEKDMTLCYKADEELKGDASVINSKYGTYDIFEDDGLKNADIFIAATKNDEYNIIKCLEAKEFGIKKVVAINNELEYYSLMHSLGLVVTRGPKISAYNKIMEEISSTGVVIKKRFCGGKGFVFMRKVFPNSKLIGKKIKPLKIKDIKIYYIREDQIYLFDEKITLKEGDLIIAFSNIVYMEKIKLWIYEL